MPLFGGLGAGSRPAQPSGFLSRIVGRMRAARPAQPSGFASRILGRMQGNATQPARPSGFAGSIISRMKQKPPKATPALSGRGKSTTSYVSDWRPGGRAGLE